MAKREGKQREFKVGDRILIELPPGNVSEGTIKAIIDGTDGRRLQVAFGYDEIDGIAVARSSAPHGTWITNAVPT